MKSFIDTEKKPTLKLGKFEIIQNPISILKNMKDIQNGYGSCRSCDCRGYISKHDGSHTCKVCHHHYDRHRD